MYCVQKKWDTLPTGRLSGNQVCRPQLIRMENTYINQLQVCFCADVICPNSWFNSSVQNCITKCVFVCFFFSGIQREQAIKVAKAIGFTGNCLEQVIITSSVCVWVEGFDLI